MKPSLYMFQPILTLLGTRALIDDVIENIVDEDPNHDKAFEKLEELEDMLYEQITEPYRGDLLYKYSVILI